MKKKFTNKENLTAFVLFFLFFIIYYLSMYPTPGGRINFGDSIKFQYLWAIDGLPHSTGYPQYMFLTKIFGNIFTFLEPYKRITIISVVSAAASLFFLYKISTLLYQGRIAKFLPVLIFGTSYIFWSQATEPEVYALSTLYLSIIVFLSIKFFHTKKLNYLLILIFVYCLSFGNHLMTITLLPAIIYLVIIIDYKLLFNRKVILVSISSIFLGMLQYYYVWYLAHGNSSELGFLGRNPSFPHFIDYITGGEFRQELKEKQTFDKIYFELSTKIIVELWKSYGLPIVTAILFFIFNKKRANQNVHILGFLVIATISQFLFCLKYDIADILVYYIPLFFFISLFIAASFDSILNTKRRNTGLGIVFILCLFLALNTYEKLIIDTHLNPYIELTTYNLKTPKSASIFLPYENFYNYNGRQTINYKKFIEKSDIQYLQWLDKTPLPSEIYFPVKFTEMVPNDLYSISPLKELNDYNLTEFIKKNKQNVIVISAKDEATTGLTQDDHKALSQRGINIKNLEKRGSYVALMSGGTVLLEKIDNKNAIIVKNNSILRKFNIQKIASAGYSFGNYSSIVVGGVERSFNKRGLNIVVLDSTNFPMYYNFDTYKSNNISPLLNKAILKQ